jgi:hypothetical protein
VKFFKKITAVAALSLAVTGSIYYSYYLCHQSAHQMLVHFKVMQQELAQYYTTGAYDHDVEKICKQAEQYFATLPVRDNSLIIFDIDDTAVYNYQKMDKFDFIWSQQATLVQAREQDMSPAIMPVLGLYQAVLSKGFKIIFLSSRNAGQYDHTVKELNHAGYTKYEKIILMPDELAFDRTIKTADWKLRVRKELAKQYDIVGSVADRPVDFAGGYTGHIVQLPNYLY